MIIKVGKNSHTIYIAVSRDLTISEMLEVNCNNTAEMVNSHLMFWLFVDFNQLLAGG